MSRRPWYKRYGGDFVLGTMALSLEEKGAYSLCLDLIYDRGGPIPDDARWLAGMCGVSLRKWAALRGRLITAGKLVERDGCLTNARASREIANAVAASAEHAENGSKGGRKRAENAAKPDRNLAETIGVDAENNDLAQAGLKPIQKPELEPESKKDANASFVAGSDAKAAFDEWNALASRLTLPQAKDLTPARRKAINARLAEAGMTGWREALAAVESSPHCRGDNDRGWRADLDFVSTPSKFAKLREGSYGPVNSASTAPPAPIFDGPPEVRSWTAERHGEPYARSYIDPSRWDAGARTLLAANPFAEGRLKRDLAEICDRWKFTVRQGAVCPPAPSNELFQQGASA